MATNLSYMNTPMKEPFMYQTLPSRLSYLAEEDPEKEAFVFYNMSSERISISRKDLHEKSIKLAKVLTRFGIKKGNTVAMCMNNSIEMLTAIMAVACAGGVTLFLSTNLKDGSDIIEIMTFNQCEMLIIDVNETNWAILDTLWPLDAEASKTVPCLKHIVCNGGKFIETKSRVSLASLHQQEVPDDTELPIIQPEDTLVYFCTSGSTGNPKVVVYTHCNIFNWTRQLDVAVKMTKESRFFCDRTFSWVVGYPRTYLTEGVTRVFVDPRFSLSGKHIHNLCDIIEQEKCDVVFVPGYIVADLSKNPTLANKFASVETVIFGGERVPKSHLFLKDTFSKNVTNLYGTTEAGGCCTFTSDVVDDYEDGIAGKALPGTEVKIIDDAGNVVPTGESGELCVRSTWRFSGYLKREDIFRMCVDSDNWLHTEDVAHMNKSGDVVIDGRMKEVISMQTNKFFPWLIENTLKTYSQIKTTIAVGVPDERLRQVVCACVIPEDDNLTIDDVRKFCDDSFLEEGTGLGITTKPRYHLIFHSFPLTPSGKIDRRRIGKQAKKRLGL